MMIMNFKKLFIKMYINNSNNKMIGYKEIKLLVKE